MARSTKEYFDEVYGIKAKSKTKFGEKVASRELVRYLARRWQGGTLVDIGCGTGAFAHEASPYFMVAAFDPSERGVRSVPDSISRKWIGAGEAMPLRSDSVDIVTCLDVVEHLPNPDTCLLETLRVLKRGGFLLVRTPNPQSFGLLLKGGRWFGFRDPTHASIGDLKTWQRRFEKCGFVIIEWGTDLLWDPPYLSVSDNRTEKLFFQGTNLIAMRVKPFFPWSRGENIYILARKS
jgi:2-polyprenyl-3-methyl-5-hydroxy-6-metoxy-1,4-benzoquinol methylase